jgi:hypothetical protein
VVKFLPYREEIKITTKAHKAHKGDQTFLSFFALSAFVVKFLPYGEEEDKPRRFTEGHGEEEREKSFLQKLRGTLCCCGLSSFFDFSERTLF